MRESIEGMKYGGHSNVGLSKAGLARAATQFTKTSADRFALVAPVSILASAGPVASPQTAPFLLIFPLRHFRGWEFLVRAPSEPGKAKPTRTSPHCRLVLASALCYALLTDQGALLRDIQLLIADKHTHIGAYSTGKVEPILASSIGLQSSYFRSHLETQVEWIEHSETASPSINGSANRDWKGQEKGWRQEPGFIASSKPWLDDCGHRRS